MLVATGAMAQKMIVMTNDGKAVNFKLSDLNCVLFEEANPNEHEWVDLKLPSGTLWATCNIGADKPEDYGSYFAWGETAQKESYTWANYVWLTEGESYWTYINKYTFADGQTTGCWYSGDTFIGDNKTKLDLEDDAASVLWGTNWRTPTQEQFEELINEGNTTTEWTTQNGINGCKITSLSNGESIFLPATGYYGSSLSGAGSNGNYWANSLLNYTERAGELYIKSGRTYFTVSDRFYGQSIRPIRMEGGTPFKLVTNIVLNHTSLDMYPNDTQQLTATVMPSDAENKIVSWESSNTAVAFVSTSGLVTAKAKGTCTITCSATDGSGVKAECRVNVNERKIPVESITLSYTSIRLQKNETQKLYAHVEPEDATNHTVSWESSNTSVATVSSNGLVTAKAVGKSTITCRATDGSGVYDECQVEVFVPQSGTTDGHQWVDLGLPSGTLWATCNVGASTPEGKGDFYAWGEIKTKEVYSVATYKYLENVSSVHDYNMNCMTKYNSKDYLRELLPEDDIATVKWGSNWQMPSYAQIQELANKSYTTVEWITQNGVIGMKVTGKFSGMSIFIPASGAYDFDGYYDDDSYNVEGCYWSRSLADKEDFSFYMDIEYGWSNNLMCHSNYRFFGYSIRPVRK